MLTSKEINLDEIVLKIIEEMQPISANAVWCEIGESWSLKQVLSQIEITQRLEKMENEKILEKVVSNNGNEKYIIKGN